MFLIMAKGRRAIITRGAMLLIFGEKNVSSKLFVKKNPSWRLSSTSLAKGS